MSNRRIFNKSTVILVLIMSGALALGDQKKTSAPPAKPAPKAAPAKPAPAVKRPATGTVNRPNTGTLNRPNTGTVNRPNTGTLSRPNTGTFNRPAAGGGNRPIRGGGNRPGVGPTHTVATRGGGRLDVDRNNRPTHFVGRGGQEAKFGAHGQVREVHDPRRNMTVQRGLRPGERRVVTERNGRRLVSDGPHRGYSERPYLNRNGHAYYQRTYYDHGHAYARVYRDHYYHGVHYYHYVPGYYYHPAFYGWAYNPWARPVVFAWGWGPSPWFYGGYFAPAPFYASPALWLTDFLLAENLKEAYEAKRDADAAAQGGGQPPPEGVAPAATGQLTPEVKEAIAAEVQRQIADEKAAAQGPQAGPAAASDQAPPAALDPKQRLFVASSSLTVAGDDGQECELTAGDVMTRIDDNPDNNNTVRVSVLTSKQQDCSVGAMPRVQVTDLQEMHNNFREQLDSGLQTLAQKSGTGGLPAAPDTQTVAGEVPPPVPDQGVDSQLADQQKDATAAEADVQQEVQSAQSPTGQ